MRSVRLNTARPLPSFGSLKDTRNEERIAMNTSLWNRQTATRGRNARDSLAGLLLGAVSAVLPFAAGAEDGFQLNALFNPTQAQQRAEARGRVMIYDGMDEQVVERALDEQFGRIEHMMFTHTRHTESDGAVSVDDDGC